MSMHKPSSAMTDQFFSLKRFRLGKKANKQETYCHPYRRVVGV